MTESLPPDPGGLAVGVGAVPPGAWWRRRRSGRATAILGGMGVGVVLIAALVSLVWTPHDPLVIHPDARLGGPSGQFVLGTDGFGRDVASLLMAGARVPLLVGAVAVAIALALGVPWGVAAAMSERTARLRGRATGLGAWMMRWNDVVQAFPPLLLAIVLAAAFGAGSWTAAVALGIGSSPGVSRVVRSVTAPVLEREFVLAARSVGRGRWYTAWRHVLPNISSVLYVQASITFALAVLAEAALSYLGLGTPAPTPSWGRMLQEGQAFLSIAPGLVLWPGLAIAWTVLGFMLLGDGLRDAGDPRMESGS